MSLRLMYITNNVDVARIAEKNGVDRIWIDIERIGKEQRQKGMDTVKSFHTLDDISIVRHVVDNSELLVRVNPIYTDSKKEIDEVVNRGADIIMLPFFSSVDQVDQFLNYVNNRAKVILLLETIGAEEIIEEILQSYHIEEVHIGLNDLHLQYNQQFMFELLANGKVDEICEKLSRYDINYGFGGIARLNEGLLPAKHIIGEHYRLGSTGAILSRGFCNTADITDIKEVEKIFEIGVSEIRTYEKELINKDKIFFFENMKKVQEEVKIIVKEINKK